MYLDVLSLVAIEAYRCHLQQRPADFCRDNVYQWAFLQSRYSIGPVEQKCDVCLDSESWLGDSNSR